MQARPRDPDRRQTVVKLKTGFVLAGSSETVPAGPRLARSTRSCSPRGPSPLSRLARQDFRSRIHYLP